MSAFIGRSNTNFRLNCQEIYLLCGRWGKEKQSQIKDKELVPNLNSKWTNPKRSKWETSNNYLQNTLDVCFPVDTWVLVWMKNPPRKIPCLKCHSVQYFDEISWYSSQRKLSTKKQSLKQKNSSATVTYSYLFYFSFTYLYPEVPGTQF